MFNFLMKCPHCLNNETFVVHSVDQYRAAQPAPVYKSGTTHSRSAPLRGNGTTAETYGVALCPRPRCGAPVLIWFDIPSPIVRLQLPHEGPKFTFKGDQPNILGTWPIASGPDDSEHWPTRLRENFREVQEDIGLGRGPARIVATCRSVLEVALAELGYPKSKELFTLQSRINKAQTDGHVTKGMAEWAAKIKVDGNEAIHELQAVRADAEALVNFIRTFLEVAFDLPQKIKSMGGPIEVGVLAE